MDPTEQSCCRPPNNRRIGLTPSLRVGHNKHRFVMFTNLSNINTINKRTSQLFGIGSDWFLNASTYGSMQSGPYFEKSERAVYEAIEKDCGSLEDQLIPTRTI